MGTFLGHSLHLPPRFVATLVAILFFISTFLRNPYGECVKSLGLMLILVVQRFSRIRNRYPTLSHVKSSLRLAPRQAFPSENPWEGGDDFSMLPTLLAMAFVGSISGGNLPLLPTWMGALIGGGLFAVWTTLNDARGDLARSMGMRVVATGQELWNINVELELMHKVGVVSGKILDKLLILDRKHRIKDRILRGASFLYDQVSKAAVSATTQGGRGEDDDRDRRRRREDDYDGYDRDRRRPRPPDDRRRSESYSREEREPAGGRWR
jgi:hypothetical protein